MMEHKQQIYVYCPHCDSAHIFDLPVNSGETHVVKYCDHATLAKKSHAQACGGMFVIKSKIEIKTFACSEI